MVVATDAHDLALVLMTEVPLIQSLHPVELLVLLLKPSAELAFGEESSQHAC